MKIDICTLQRDLDLYYKQQQSIADAAPICDLTDADYDLIIFALHSYWSMYEEDEEMKDTVKQTTELIEKLLKVIPFWDE